MKALLPLFLASALVASASVTENFTATHPLDKDGSLTLDNINGPVEIIGWDRNEVSIEAIKEASDAEGLKRMHIRVDATPAAISIKTEHDKTWKFWGTFQASVQYKIHVPAKARLEKINTINASITVSGVHGPVNLDTTNGRIQAMDLRADARLDSVNGSLSAGFSSLKNVRNVKLESVNGRLEITLPKNADANLSTRTVNGSTSVAQAIKLEKSGKLGVSGQLGKGGATIQLETVNGDISIFEK